MLLVAKTKTWGPRWPQFNSQTHKIERWIPGRWDPGKPPVEWPGDLELAPDSLVATNDEDQAKLDEVRAAKRARVALAQRERKKAAMQRELREELKEEARAEAKAMLRELMAAELAEVKAQALAEAQAEPAAAPPVARNKPGPKPKAAAPAAVSTEG